MKISRTMVICSGIFFVFFMMTTGIVAAGSESNSVIYEDRIAWQDDSNGNLDIQMYNISTSTKTQITSDKADQQNPDIYGNNIVWQDSRNGGGGNSWEPPSGDWDIYAYNISTQKETQITRNGSTQANPAIYKDKIVWQDFRNGNWDIYMYNISTSTETRITHNSSDQTSPDIYEDRIVWVEEAKISMYNLTTAEETRVSPGPGWQLDFDSDPSIYKDKIVCSAETVSTNYIVKVYDLSNSTEKVITNYNDYSSSPDIYEDRIVWIDNRNMIDVGQWNSDIFMYNLSTSKEIQITTNKSNQVKPAIYGNTIVWTDERNAVTYNDISDIYMYNLATFKETRLTTVAEEQHAQGIETRITTDKGEQEYPAIYENRIVWRDWRNGNQHDYINGDIYMYDLSTSKETQITTNKSTQVNPDIYKDRIVWEDDRNGGENWDIYMYNLSTKKETQITANKSNQLSPAIYGDKIVWVDQRNGYPNNDIYMYDLSTRKETQITTNGSNQQSPKIYGDRIVWEDWRNGDDYNLNSDIYMYDLSTFKEIQITTDKSYQGEPAIYGDRIVWTDQRRNGNWDIYMYNLSTSVETQIPIRGGEEKHVSDIYRDRIVWNEIRKLSRDWSIYMYNISTANETQILGTGTNSWQGYPKIYGDRIVWVDTRNGNPDIYMFTLQGSEQTAKPPISDFSATPLSGKAPLKVKFTSTSTGSPNTWKWNFGDGSPLSTERNPEHIYSKAGVYTVKHTAINAFGRDTEIKTKYINVQAQIKAPVAAFSASPRSGKAPLKVRFTDKSINNPASWKWSFGDGTYSTVKNPVHTYSKAGKYNVSLTVKNAKGKNTKITSGYIVVAKK